MIYPNSLCQDAQYLRKDHRVEFLIWRMKRRRKIVQKHLTQFCCLRTILTLEDRVNLQMLVFGSGNGRWNHILDVYFLLFARSSFKPSFVTVEQLNRCKLSQRCTFLQKYSTKSSQCSKDRFKYGNVAITLVNSSKKGGQYRPRCAEQSQYCFLGQPLTDSVMGLYCGL